MKNELKTVKGLGDKTLLLLNKLNIYEFKDLVAYYPYKYNFLSPQRLIPDVPILVNAKILTAPSVYYIKKNLNRLTFKALVDNKEIKVSIFNRAFLKVHLRIGKVISLLGKYAASKNTFACSDIKLTPILRTTIEPVYHLVSGLTNKSIAKVISNALIFRYNLNDDIPLIYKEKYNFLSKEQATLILHNPTNLAELKQARLRTIYEELFTFAFKINYLKMKNATYDGLKRKSCLTKVKKFIKDLPFTLTPDQETAVWDIYDDLISEKRMNRLLLGDVGSGKTIVAALAMYINYLSGYQSVIMAPTEILAKQHFEELTKTYKPYGINVAYLTGSMKKSLRSKVLNDLKNGQIDIIVGTHSLLNEEVTFPNLGLVITDEQHRFGVNQRTNLQNKGAKCDVLYLSATPIPRTYALTLYGDMDISMIKTKPVGRKEITTKVFTMQEISTVLKAILEELKQGHQIYVVAPLIEDEEENGIDVKTLAKNYEKAFGAITKIAVIHGKLKQSEKDQIMQDYLENKIGILISTTVIEVGINVSNATMMVIYSANRFGLATLHQLRGRVGRNDIASFCYLISDAFTPRLKVMEESNDGFYISEKDFEIRGEGDLFGTMQSGDMKFKMADLRKDMKIFMQAKKDSLEYLSTGNLATTYQNIIKEIDFLQ